MAISEISTAQSPDVYQYHHHNEPDRQGTIASTNGDLSADEKRVVNELKRVDAETRTHERAHIAAGREFVRGGASYQYKTGPDGRRYAVGGEVSIDTSDVPDNPEATAEKMDVVRRAALAPANPSPQDRAAASQASRRAAHARQKISRQKMEKGKEQSGGTETSKARPDMSKGYTARGEPASSANQEPQILDLTI